MKVDPYTHSLRSFVRDDHSQHRRIRVLQVVEAIGGGVKRHLMSILATIDRERFDVEVVGPALRPEKGEGDKYVSELAALGVRFHAIDMRWVISPRQDMAALARLWWLIWRGGYDVVHGHSSKGGFLARAAGWLTGTPTAYTPHGLYFLRFPPGRRRFIYRSLERIAGLFTTRFVAVSESEAGVALAEGLAPARKIVVIPNGVEPQAFHHPSHARAHVRAELGIGLDAVVIGAAGRLSVQKNPECLVRAMREVIQRTKREVYLVWAGGGELEREVRSLVAECGLEQQCRLVGDRQDVKALMCAFDVLALTSRYEGLPYALLEAMAVGLPVVATDVVGTRDVVRNGVNGYLVPSESPTAVAEALLTLVNSDRRRSEFGDRGRRMVAEHFTVESTTRRLEALYTDLAERRHDSPSEGRWLRRETAST